MVACVDEIQQNFPKIDVRLCLPSADTPLFGSHAILPVGAALVYTVLVSIPAPPPAPPRPARCRRRVNCIVPFPSDICHDSTRVTPSPPPPQHPPRC
jgi:hypothetical protein